ncbi:MAG: phenylalanine--tRNA ligase subunit beta [Proteobacteria bacterium]|nr:phenylalanine--tRNA ligase subunit beta [Pseudomonadota bacterium]
MKFSEKWLRDLIDPGLAHDDLMYELTMAGLEVESVEPVSGAFEGVVVARVVSSDKHPDADKLSVCQVDDGHAVHQVVCGAPNVRAGLVTAYARIGAVLPGDFKIKKAKLRGVESSGMLCSAAELGVSTDADGIIELPEDLPTGQTLVEALSLADVSVDLNLTPNRGDCLSMRGLAREVGVLSGKPVNATGGVVIPASIDTTFPVELADPQGCPRYVGRVVEGVDISRPSPLWMTEALRRSGLRSISAIVDITNFVMLELGQPMHAFDLGRLNERIVVRRADEGEQLTLLDGTDVQLDADTLLITDTAGPIAIAGVMGGERSGIQADTRDVFLESAFFAPLPISGTARRYGLHTDASHRYERGVDYELQTLAIERATELMLQIVGGSAGPVVETVSTENLPEPVQVRLRQRRLNELLGVDIEPEVVDHLFERLHFKLVNRMQDAHEGVIWTIEVPSHRFDVSIEADLVEEVCRIHGYNNIESRMPLTHLELRKVVLERSTEAQLKAQLAGLGYQEVITYSFVDPRQVDLYDPTAQPMTLANPMSSEQSVMRTNLLPGLMSALQTNVARQQSRVRLFELGLCFVPGEKLEQVQMLGGLIWGDRLTSTWHSRSELVDFYDIKGDLEHLLNWAGVKDVEYVKVKDEIMHPGQSAEIRLGDRKVGRIGRLHPEIEKKLDLPHPGYFFEIAGDTILVRPRRLHTQISKYPSVRRDLALVINEAVSAFDIEKTVREACGAVLIDFTLFDVYRGKGIDSKEKSVAVGLTLQDPSATLTDAEIAKHVNHALQALQQRFDARLR